ncbi:MAG: oligosaccharide flippase family protein [Ignavibacteriae bacterium]|nr:oligosaccharide flippase family protein [Ignavibacteriota bacterium]
MSILFLPYYIKIIGIEAYGIVGFYITLLALSQLLDLGLCMTVNREMARLLPHKNGVDECRHMTRTLEWIYWPMAVLIATVIAVLAPYLANDWIKAQELTKATVRQAIYCAGIALAFQWPGALYAGGLTGLQKQVLLNVIIIIFATLRALGMIVVLTFISPTIQAFFLWQTVSNTLQTITVAICFWKNLQGSLLPPQFDWKILKRVKGFALGIASTTVLVVIASQLDRAILSKMLTLEMFGYYSLAGVIASTLHYATGSIYNTFFPRFSQLVSMNDEKALKHAYHSGCQLMAVVAIPCALMVALFSNELMFFWTGNAETAERTSTLISLLTTGTLLNGLLMLPYALQLAYGWTKLGLYQCLVVIVVQIPLLILGVIYYGVTAAAWVSIMLNFFLFFITIPLMHRKIIRQEKMRWYLQDVAFPLFASLAMVLTGRWLFLKIDGGQVVQISAIVIIFIFSFLSAVLAAPLARQRAIQFLLKKQATMVNTDG